MRLCKTCEIVKELNEFDLGPSGSPRRVCRNCRRKYARDYYHRNKKPGPGSGHPNLSTKGEYIGADAKGRTCLECKAWKSKDNYWVNKKRSSSPTLYPYCNDCRAKRLKAKHLSRLEKEGESYKKKLNDSNKASKKRLKDEVITAYGGRCACCQETRVEFLTLDHVNNDGATHRKKEGIKTGTSTWAWARANGFPSTLQLLCWNCNSSKGAYGYCPHNALIVC